MQTIAGIKQTIALAMHGDGAIVSSMDFFNPKPIPIAEVAIANKLNILKNFSMYTLLDESQRNFINSPTEI